MIFKIGNHEARQILLNSKTSSDDVILYIERLKNSRIGGQKRVKIVAYSIHSKSFSGFGDSLEIKTLANAARKVGTVRKRDNYFIFSITSRGLIRDMDDIIQALTTK